MTTLREMVEGSHKKSLELLAHAEVGLGEVLACTIGSHERQRRVRNPTVRKLLRGDDGITLKEIVAAFRAVGCKFYPVAIPLHTDEWKIIRKLHAMMESWNTRAKPRPGKRKGTPCKKRK